jgi:hypothetical protein
MEINLRAETQSVSRSIKPRLKVLFRPRSAGCDRSVLGGSSLETARGSMAFKKWESFLSYKKVFFDLSNGFEEIPEWVRIPTRSGHPFRFDSGH